MRKLQVPIPEEVVRDLAAGEPVSLSGIIVTGRDAAHKYMIENFVRTQGNPPEPESEVYDALKDILRDGVIYHCGPVVSQENGVYRFVAAGPTTSSREEPYQADVIAHFGLRAVIGKGGMGPKTAAACQQHGAVYLHAIGGAASFIAQSVKEVLAVHKLDFGVPEAFWVIRVEDFPAVVTIDSHGSSLHQQLKERSAARLAELLKN